MSQITYLKGDATAPIGGDTRFIAHVCNDIASVHMPRIGCGLAGGTWDQFQPLIEETLLAANIPVFIYDSE